MAEDRSRVVALLPQSNPRSVEISEERPSSEWLARIVTAMLSIYDHRWNEDQEVVEAQMALWEDTLSDLPLRAIDMAVKARLRLDDRRRPIPAEIRKAAIGFIRSGHAAPEPPPPFAPNAAQSPEARKRIEDGLARLSSDLAAVVEANNLGRAISPVRNIIKAVAEVCNLAEAAITGHRRDVESSRARFLVYLLARRHTGKTFPQIAKAVGGRDHSTVVHGIGRAEELLASDPEFAALLDAAERKLAE